MRSVLFNRPFVGGVVTDQPAYKLGPQFSAGSTDAVAPYGITRQRYGWRYYRPGAGVGKWLAGVHRNRYSLAGAVRTVLSAYDGELLVQHDDGTLTRILAPGDHDVEYLPRCVYRDQLVLCAQDGLSPARFFSGATDTIKLSDGLAAFKISNALFQATTSAPISPPPARGSYITWQADAFNRNIRIYPRILEHGLSGGDGGNWVTLEDVNAEYQYLLTVLDNRISPTGLGWPGCAVYQAGTAAFDEASGKLKGTGTKWATGGLALSPGSDMLVLVPGAGEDAGAYSFFDVNDDTTLGRAGGGSGVGDVPTCTYRVQRRLPWRDAAAHKDSLFGTGFDGFKNRVWMGPKGWNPMMPPGDIPPYDPSAPYTRTNDSDFTLDYIDVPAAFDGDSNVALLSSPDPLIVLKTRDAWGLAGSYPDFERYLLPGGEGAGCLDIRSAHTLSAGPVWAGKESLFIFSGGIVNDITRDRISREWRAQTADFDPAADVCTIGEQDGHLFVSLRTGPDGRTMIFDLRTQAWVSNQVSNHLARYYFSSKVDGEPQRLLWTSATGGGDVGRVRDSSGVIEPAGNGAHDGDGHAPALDCWTGAGVDGYEEIDTESRVYDAAVSTNVRDPGAPGASALEVSLISDGALFSDGVETTVLGEIQSDADGRPERTLFDPINQEGRTHQLRLRTTATGSDSPDTRIEIPELTMTIQDIRSRT